METTKKHTTHHIGPQGREYTFEGQHLYRVNLHWTLEEATCAFLAKKGLKVPTLEDMKDSDETYEVAADREGLARTHVMFLTEQASGLIAEYDVETVA